MGEGMGEVSSEWSVTLQGYSLSTDVISDIFRYAKPLGHNENQSEMNLGFGFLYYGVVRVIRPKHILVIGSGFGFSVVCLALGLRDNGRGKLSFVDPSYDVLRHGPFKTIGGRGNWSSPEEVTKHFALFGVSHIVTHYKLRTDEFFPLYDTFGLPDSGIAFVDGNHSYKNVRYDFTEIVGHTKKNAYIFLHDTNIYIREVIRNSGVKRWLKEIRKNPECFELLDFPFSSGVAIVRILRDDAWMCLN
jgi:hypothetical protein